MDLSTQLVGGAYQRPKRIAYRGGVVETKLTKSAAQTLERELAVQITAKPADTPS